MEYNKSVAYINLSEVKDYLRITFDDDDSVIINLMDAATEYLINAGCVLDFNKNLSKLALCMLVAHWYDYRGVQGDEKYFPMGLQTIILQLKGATIAPL